MKAEDTVMTDDDLCKLICMEHRAKTLDGKNCDDLDCNQCQLEKQAEISFKAGLKHGIWLFAWWKDGVQHVGTSGKTLQEAYKELDIEVGQPTQLGK